MAIERMAPHPTGPSANAPSITERTRPLLAIDPSDVARLPPEALPAVLAVTAAIQGAVAARLASGVTVPGCERQPVPGGQGKEGDRWLRPDEAATLASVSRRAIYGWSRRLDWRPFVRRLSRKALRIEEQGFRRWLARQGPR